MPATTVAKPQGPKPQANQPSLLVPFTRAAQEHFETFIDVSQILTAGSTQLGPFDIPAYGFMRGIELNIEATGGVGGGATVAAFEDSPWSVIGELTLQDVNGAPIIGPLSGHDLYLLNRWGGYNPNSPDPKQDSSYSAVATGAGASGNFAFQLRIPIEVCARDALGALANQNAASTYKLRMTLAPASQVYTTAPATTLPTVRIRGTLDAWTQPTGTDLRGNAQATNPPAHGTTAYWSKTLLQVSQGYQTLRLPRVGNYVRDLVFVWRGADGTRTSTASQNAFPDPLSIFWDTRLLKQYPRPLWRNQMKRRLDFTGSMEGIRGLDASVYVEDFCHDFTGMLGFELRDLWLPTLQSTRLEVAGTFGQAGTLTVLTNDVAPAGEIYV